MKHFANYIDMCPLSAVSSIDGSTINTNDGSEPDRIYSFSDIVVDENPEETGAGVKYVQKTRVVSNEKLSAAQKQKYGNLRPVVVLLFDDAGIPVPWGYGSEKLRILIKPTIEHDVLDFTRESITPLL